MCLEILTMYTHDDLSGIFWDMLIAFCTFLIQGNTNVSGISFQGNNYIGIKFQRKSISSCLYEAHYVYSKLHCQI